MWNDLFAAIALVLVIEGLLPFLNPQGMRRTYEHLTQLPDGTLRGIGLASMIGGAVLLYVVRQF